MPDTPQRIALAILPSGSCLSVFGETIKEYLARDELDVKPLKFIPMGTGQAGAKLPVRV